MAGLIPQSFIDDLINRLDIVDVVSSRVQLKKNRQKLLGLLPVPQREDTVLHGQPRQAVLLLLRLRRRRQRPGLRHGPRQPGLPPGCRRTGPRRWHGSAPRASRRDQKPRQPTDSPLYPLLDAASEFYRQALRSHPTRKAAVDYLKGRGLSGRSLAISAWASPRPAGTTCSSTWC